MKIQSRGNDWQLPEECNLVNGPECTESRGRGEESTGFRQIEVELSGNRDSISELPCFFRNILEYEKCLNLQCGSVD